MLTLSSKSLATPRYTQNLRILGSKTVPARGNGDNNKQCETTRETSSNINNKISENKKKLNQSMVFNILLCS